MPAPLLDGDDLLVFLAVLLHLDFQLIRLIVAGSRLSANCFMRFHRMFKDRIARKYGPVDEDDPKYSASYFNRIAKHHVRAAHNGAFVQGISTDDAVEGFRKLKERVDAAMRGDVMPIEVSSSSESEFSESEASEVDDSEREKLEVDVPEEEKSEGGVSERERSPGTPSFPDTSEWSETEMSMPSVENLLLSHDFEENGEEFNIA